MAKDPAFLFYSKAFYEGTRMMLPEERACFIDLMIYQHQHGFIPTDTKRLLLYCGGIAKATLEATLEAKFKLCDKGWYNQKLSDVMEERKEFSEKQALNGRVGQFFKKAKAELNAKDYLKLFTWLKEFNNEEKLKIINDFEEKNKAMLIPMLEAMLKHIVDINKDESANVDVGKDVKKDIPEEAEFLAYCKEQIPDTYQGLEFSLKAKRLQWIDNGWKDGNGSPIKNWKSKILNTIPYLKHDRNTQTKQLNGTGQNRLTAIPGRDPGKL